MYGGMANVVHVVKSNYTYIFILQGAIVLNNNQHVLFCLLFTGYLYSIERKYAFYFSGAAMVLSGLISFPLRKISHWERKKRGEISNSSTTSDDEMKQHQFIKPVELVGM